MRLHEHHIITIQQPVQLLTGQHNHLTANPVRPFEARSLEALQPQEEAVAYPVLDLDFVAEVSFIVHLSFQSPVSFKVFLSCSTAKL